DQRGVALHLVPAGALGMVDGLVGALERGSRRVSGTDLREADADRDATHLRERVLCGVVAEALEGMRRIGLILAAHQHDELLAAETVEQIIEAEADALRG